MGRASSYLPSEDAHLVLHWDSRKEDISIADILSMSSGMKCNEGAMYETDDWVKSYLDQPMFAQPGKAFSCNTCGAVTLGSVISTRIRHRIPAFADRYLFAPMNITARRWPITNSLGSQGLAMTGGGLQLRPRDMAKFGQFYLDDGVWHGHRLLSSRWIRASTERHATSDMHERAEPSFLNGRAGQSDDRGFSRASALEWSGGALAELRPRFPR